MKPNVPCSNVISIFDGRPYFPRIEETIPKELQLIESIARQQACGSHQATHLSVRRRVKGRIQDLMKGTTQ